jgi:hypothetical protein
MKMLGLVDSRDSCGKIIIKCWDGEDAHSDYPQYHLRKGDAVCFTYDTERCDGKNKRKRIANEQNIECITPMDCEARKKCFNDINRNWKLEATNENIKYFYITSEAKEVLAGDKCFVIGRKGTGKTAIRNYIISKAENEPHCFTRVLSFENFPFYDLQQYSESGFVEKTQYLSFWKYIILSSLAQMLLENNGISSTTHEKLKPIFQPSLKETLLTNIKTWTGAKFSIATLSIGGVRENSDINIPLNKKVNILQNYLFENIGSGFTYSILFDELDEGYADINFRNKYNDLLTSLFKAVSELKQSFNDCSSCLNPVIFLRDDIFDQLEDTNTNKWMDWQIDLSWNPTKILTMLSHRVSVSCEADIEADKLFALISDLKPMKHHYHKQRGIDLFNYMKVRSLNRPRDFITWVIHLARSSINGSNTLIRHSNVKNAEASVSKNMRTEFENELLGSRKMQYPTLPFELLTIIGKNSFSYHEFKTYYDYFGITRLLEITDIDFLNLLFKYSILGYRASNNSFVFRYGNSQIDKINMNKDIAIAACLCEELKIPLSYQGNSSAKNLRIVKEKLEKGAYDSSHFFFKYAKKK